MNYKKNLGFTLIELLVTISLIAVLMMLAAPSFQDFYRSSQLSSSTNNLINALNSAKNEAIKNNGSSYLVPRDGSKWSSGWFVFVDHNFDQKYTAGTDFKVMEEDSNDNIEIIGNGTAGGNSPYVSFNGSGYPKNKDAGAFSALTFTIKIKNSSKNEEIQNTRLIKLALTGRIRSCRPNFDSDCTPPTNNQQPTK